VQVCPVCSQENPDGFRFCGSCGAPLAASPPAREERKVVSVLFTDLVGFTSRSEKLDPEDVRALLQPYYARLREQIEERGGLVEKFIGDAVVAVFGAPVAHEDDPERAVRTALAIREAIRELNELDPGLELQIRTAVNTGEAIVVLDARVAQGEGIASGDVVNTAARLQAAAPVDGILVGNATFRATRNMIEYREAPLVDAKGKSQPLHAWEVVAARSRFGIDVMEQQRRSPLVGRERELAVLVDAFERCKGERTAQLVTLVGVPGIGKSRLVAELFQTLDADPGLYWWRQGRSLPWGESQSFWALAEIVKAQAGILETDDARDAEAKLARLVTELVPEGERAWVESHVRPLVGIATGAGESADRRDEAFSAWRLVVEGLAEQRPLVLVFEDLHWADDGLLDFVDYLAEWVADVPLLVVGTARPELLSRRPDWGGGKRNATTLSIGALSNDETAKLLHQLLDRVVLDADMQQQVLGRAEGNPLYAAEYARMLADHPGKDLPLPETIQGVIAARIDALTPAEKALVQDAAVFGKVFWPSALEREGIEDALRALERKEFVRRERRSAVAGETQYAFLHLLVRDVAYGQIPRASRVDRHRAAAEWLESLAPDRSEDRAEMLAYHYVQALELAEAAGLDAGDLREPAHAALADAAERASALNSWPAARDLARKALALAPGDAELLLLAARAGFLLMLAESVDEAAAARDAFLAEENPDAAAEAEELRQRSLWRSGRVAESAEAGRSALALTEGLPPSPRVARVLGDEAARLILAGDNEQALELADRALAMAELLELPDVASRALNARGLARVMSGDAGGVADSQRAVEVVEVTNAVDAIVSASNNLAVLLMLVGRLDEASAEYERTRELCERFGYAWGLLWNVGVRARMSLFAGDLDGALAGIERYFELARGEQYLDVSVLGLRSEILLARGRIDEAVADVDLALERIGDGGDPQQRGPALLASIRALHAAGRRDEAEAALAEVLESERLAPMQHSYALALHLAELGRGDELLAAPSRVYGYVWEEAANAAAGGDLVHAADLYSRIGMPYVEAWARLVAAEHGEHEQLEPAFAYFAGVDATLFVRRCQALLPASA